MHSTRTVLQGLQQAQQRHAPVMQATFREAIEDGYGEHPFTIYTGIPFDTSVNSNCQRCLSHWAARGYKVVEQYKGARAGRSLYDGHIVVVVLSK